MVGLSLFKARSVNSCGKVSKFSEILEVNVISLPKKKLYVKVQECGVRIAFQGTGQLSVNNVPLPCTKQFKQYTHCFKTLDTFNSTDAQLVFKVRNHV